MKQKLFLLMISTILGFTNITVSMDSEGSESTEPPLKKSKSDISINIMDYKDASDPTGLNLYRIKEAVKILKDAKSLSSAQNDLYEKLLYVTNYLKDVKHWIDVREAEEKGIKAAHLDRFKKLLVERLELIDTLSMLKDKIKEIKADKKLSSKDKKNQLKLVDEQIKKIKEEISKNLEEQDKIVVKREAETKIRPGIGKKLKELYEQEKIYKEKIMTAFGISKDQFNSL